MVGVFKKEVLMSKIVIIDDHQLFLDGLKFTLENENNVVTTFDSPIKALVGIKTIEPDLILMDLSMPEMSGNAMLIALMKAEIASPVVVLSACETYQDVYLALQNGAMGFIPKSYSFEAMQEALKVIFKGDLFIPEDIVPEIDKIAQREAINKQEYNLSERQIQILKLIHDGKKNREIADELCISQDTVKFHQKRLYSTLNVSGALSRIEAVEKALSIGLLKA